MHFHLSTSELFVPDGARGLEACTHMGVSAHQDDIEIMAYHGVLECFGKSDRGFAGVVVTNGSGSPRDGLYAKYTDEEMMIVRRAEQKKAAVVGDYCAQALLDYPSSAVKDAANPDVMGDLKALLLEARPDVVYTHNLADKHDTHVAVTLRLIAAIRQLPNEARPKKVLGCEVWRDLDWLHDDDKQVLDVSAHESLAAALLGVFDSQICGGKRYDLATMGRRRAHATYHASHGTDASTGLNFAMDLTPLVQDLSLDPLDYATGFITRFAQDVRARIAKLSS